MSKIVEFENYGIIDNMRGEIIYKILDSLGDAMFDQVDFITALLSAGYGATGGKIDYHYRKIKDERISSQIKQQKINNFKKYLYKLKSEGMILESKSKQVYLSEKGKKKLSNLQNSFSLNKNLYKPKTGDRVTVISYDIPVVFNRERNILRDMLRVFGFNLVHKSVWVGKVTVPERFIFDLNRLGIMDYVEILEVTKNGTLKSKS